MKRDRQSVVAFILRKRFRETISDPKWSEEVAIHLRLRTSDGQTVHCEIVEGLPTICQEEQKKTQQAI